MYHLDMTGNGLFIVPPKTVCAKGIRQVQSVTSGKRGKYVTVNEAVNTIGKYVPPEFMFPRVDFQNHTLTGARTAWIVGANLTGSWLCEAFYHFVRRPHFS